MLPVAGDSSPMEAGDVDDRHLYGGTESPAARTQDAAIAAPQDAGEGDNYSEDDDAFEDYASPTAQR